MNAKKLWHRWMSLGSLVAFYSGFFISLLLVFISKSPLLFQITNLICTALFLSRIIYRARGLRNLDYYSLHDESQSIDRRMRGHQLGDIVAIILYLLLFISEFTDIMIQYGDSLLWVIIIYASAYFALASLAITRNRLIYRIACILASTIQGLILCFILMVFLLLQARSLMEGHGFNLTFTIDNATSELFIGGGFLFESTPYLTLVTTLISTLLYISFIVGTPVYQLEQTALGFKITTIIVALGSIVAFFATAIIAPQITQYATAALKNTAQKGILPADAPPELILYLKNYTKTNLSNLFYLLLIPYTFGILIANLFLDLKKNYSAKHVKAALKNFLQAGEVADVAQYDRNMKKFLYYGGELWKYEVQSMQLKYESVLQDIQSKVK